MLCFKCLKERKKENKYGLHEKCFRKWFKVSEDTEFRDLEIRSELHSKKERGQRSWNSIFFQGNYKKYSANLANESYILKLKEKQCPELPEVEFISNEIASVLKIPVPEYYMILLFNERVFVTRNFCRTSNKRMTFNHIYKYLSQNSKFNCETLIDIISKKTEKFNDVLTFIKTCLFDALIGNHDRHGRNIGFIVTSTGTRLSPIYDNPSQLGLESGEFLKMHWSPKGKIWTKTSKEPTPKDYVKEFRRLGYGDLVYEFIKEINEKEIMKKIDKGLCTKLMKKALKKLIRERIQEYVDCQ